MRISCFFLLQPLKNTINCDLPSHALNIKNASETAFTTCCCPAADSPLLQHISKDQSTFPSQSGKGLSLESQSNGSELLQFFWFQRSKCNLESSSSSLCREDRRLTLPPKVSSVPYPDTKDIKQFLKFTSPCESKLFVVEKGANKIESLINHCKTQENVMGKGFRLRFMGYDKGIFPYKIWECRSNECRA
ncbi:hypothetical protein YC2023_002111 [Brassica napus]